MSKLTRDGTAEPVSRDQILRRERAQENISFPAQLTTSRIGNLTRLIHDFAICVEVRVKGARPDGGRVIDALFFSRITFSFFEQHHYIVLVTPPLWWHMWGAVLAVERATIS